MPAVKSIEISRNKGMYRLFDLLKLIHAFIFVDTEDQILVLFIQGPVSSLLNT